MYRFTVSSGVATEAWVKLGHKWFLQSANLLGIHCLLQETYDAVLKEDVLTCTAFCSILNTKKPPFDVF